VLLVETDRPLRGEPRTPPRRPGV